MPEIHKYLGIPGSGKTTALLKKLKNIDSSGYNPDDACVVTYSKSQANDFKERIEEADGRKRYLPYYGTIHHVCVQLLDWDIKNKKPRLVDKGEEDRKDYVKRYGLSYPTQNNGTETPDSNITETDTEDKTDGEKIFAVINRCNSLRIPLKNWQKTSVFFSDLDSDNVYAICSGWSNYKESKNIVDYDDMILKTLDEKLVPPTKVLFVDEFQDMTPLLYALFSMWAKEMDIVVVAGDDDQTIFTYAGATPDFLLDLPGTEEILSTSHRVPDNILKPAQMLINQVKHRRKKEFKAEHPGGIFKHLLSPSDDELLKYIPFDQSVYFLFRTNYLASIFAKRFLMENGIPFTNIKIKQKIPTVWTNKMLELCSAVTKLEQKLPLSFLEVKRLISILPVCSKSHTDAFVYYGVKSKINKKAQHQAWNREDITKELLAKIPRWYNPVLVKHMTPHQQKAYNQYMMGDFKTVDPNNIKIGTMHSAKGLEADVVFVFNNHTRRTEEALLSDPEAWEQEARLYYVGMTRAMKTCILVEDYFQKHVFDMRVSL